jgi:SAM-dependent methyltransferase
VDGAGEHAFTDVDSRADRESWVGVLDRVREEPAYAAYKRRTIELLEPRRGGRYLEVGAGAGTDALEVARLHGVEVVGVDSSRTMIDEAQRRGLASALVADAHALPFEPDSFDGAWSDRTFQHLADPVAALGELVRVTRPGGTVVVVDPDYDTQVVNVPDQELARRVLAFRRDVLLRNGALAHQMSRLLVQAGLEHVRVETAPVALRDPAALDGALGLRDWARIAHRRGLLPAADADAWEAALDEAAAGGWFLYAFSLFLTAGQKPAGG